MVDCVEGLGEIHCHCHRATGRALLIETRNNLLDQRKEGRSSGVTPTETVLSGSQGDVVTDVWKHKSLKHLRGWA